MLNIANLHSHVHFRINMRNTFIIPFISSAVMGAAVYGISRLLQMLLPAAFASGRAGLSVIVVICMCIALFVYAVLLAVLRAFTKEELLEMPMGLRLYRLLNAMRLM